MSLTDSLSRGIDSATYNPAAEKAAAERDAAALPSKEKFKKLLSQVKADVDSLISKNTMSNLSLPKYTELIKTNNDYITTTATGPTWDQRTQLLKDTEADLNIYNDALLNLEYIARTGPAVIDDMDKKKQTPNPDFVKSMTPFFKDLDTYNKGASSIKTIDIQNKLKSVSASLRQSVPQPYLDLIINPKNSTVVSQNKKLNDANQKAQDEQFNLFRLLGTIKDTATTVVSSLFYIMICLVAGTLAANDAIGRDVQYRVLYFIYGFIFGPVVILYYLYRWYNKDAPYIYRMLPIFTTEADSTLMRMFFYPFTYKEDKRATDAYADFMKQSADLVGGSVEAMEKAKASAATNASSLLKGVEAMSLSASTVAEATAATTLTGAPASGILKAMEGLRVGTNV
jgi:hypothetical protein